MRGSSRIIAAVIFSCAIILLCRAVPPAGGEAEEESVRVYRDLRPSVVSLKNAEGSGTGIILSADGLILTNAHVAVSPVPFQVQVDAGQGADAKPIVFDKVTVVGFHPVLDLALVKVNPADLKPPVTLKPVTLCKTRGEPGQRVYAIGDPGAGGMILTKTITSGMLSGVDRKIDGQNYYQIDAAINPGNSGGPVVDHNGKVLGLVTFKFTGVDAIGFAIPLDTLNTRDFVPLSQRPSNPSKAAELVKIGQKYADLADQVARKPHGAKSAERKMYDAYAAMCFRMAIMLNPSDPELYLDYGRVTQPLDNVISLSYLARGIQLRPWGKDADIYREFGLGLAKRTRDKLALHSWDEGLAKFPYSPRVWEEEARTFIKLKEYDKAAVDAATALLLDGHSDAAKKLLADARPQVTGAAAKTLESRISNESITARLDKMLDASNAARAKKITFIHADFEKILEPWGGPPIAGVEKSIPTAPQPRSPQLPPANAK